MPVDRETNLGSLFIAVDGGEPFEISRAACHLEGDLEINFEAPEDFIHLGDLTEPMTFTISMRSSSTGYKNIMHLCRRGNNWRRMHGLKLIRVPMKERRKKNG